MVPYFIEGYEASLKSDDFFAKAAGAWSMMEYLIRIKPNSDSIYHYLNLTNYYLNKIPKENYPLKNWGTHIKNLILSIWYKKNNNLDSLRIINNETITALQDNLQRKLIKFTEPFKFHIAESHFFNSNYDSAMYYLNLVKPLSDESFYSISLWNRVVNLKFKIYSELNDYKNSTFIAKEIFQLNAKLNQIDPRIKMLEHLKNIDAEKKQQSIEHEKQQKELILLVVSIILSTVAVFIFILNNRYKKIRSLNFKLDEANVTKNKLFRVISHDLSGPVDSALIISEQIDLYKDKMSKEDLAHNSALVHKSIVQLKSILSTLLEWSKVNLDGFKTSRLHIEVSQSIKDAIEDLSFQIKTKNIEIKIIKNHNLIVGFDADSLRVVLRNILSNAIKFSPNNSEIIININQNSITIIDSGKGFPENILTGNLHAITSKSGTNNERGLGLGLQIVMDILVKNDTNIKFKNQDNGNGCVELIF